jgi:DnaJ-domain-containing protein 1
VSLGRRLWDVVRSNANDFSRSLFGEGDGLGEQERAEVEAELKETLGSRAGKQARKVKDVAEEAWERAYRASQARGGGPSSEEQIAEWYRTLELDEGADFRQVRRAYRKLLAKYHPDRYASDPEKYQAATAVARRITVAYNGLKTHLGG